MNYLDGRNKKVPLIQEVNAPEYTMIYVFESKYGIVTILVSLVE